MEFILEIWIFMNVFPELYERYYLTTSIKEKEGGTLLPLVEGIPRIKGIS